MCNENNATRDRYRGPSSARAMLLHQAALQRCFHAAGPGTCKPRAKKQAGWERRCWCFVASQFYGRRRTEVAPCGRGDCRKRGRNSEQWGQWEMGQKSESGVKKEHKVLLAGRGKINQEHQPTRRGPPLLRNAASRKPNAKKTPQQDRSSCFSPLTAPRETLPCAFRRAERAQPGRVLGTHVSSATTLRCAAALPCAALQAVDK